MVLIMAPLNDNNHDPWIRESYGFLTKKIKGNRRFGGPWDRKLLAIVAPNIILTPINNTSDHFTNSHFYYSISPLGFISYFPARLCRFLSKWLNI